MEHTKGPWRPYQNRSSHKWRVFAGTPPNDDVVAFIDGGFSEDAEANCRLIAAAPELLEALKKTRTSLGQSTHASYCGAEETDWGCSCGLTAACVAADMAIAKAEGH